MVSSHSDTAARQTSLPEDQLAQLNDAMNTLAKKMQWSDVLENDEDVPFILSPALARASTALQSSNLKDRIIAPKSIPNTATLEELSSEQKAEWGILLMRALKSGDWKELIAHPILQVHSSLPAPSSRHQRSLNTEVYQQAVSVAWNGEYRERYHELLLDNINHLKREKPYSKSVTIIQSSGTGKSRMVREQSDLVFTLPFNLRPHHESKDIAYPPPDTEIGNYLGSLVSNLHEAQTRCLHLLGHLFRTVSEEMGRLYCVKQPTYAALAKSWRKHMDESQNRTRIYKNVVDSCRGEDLRTLQEKYALPEKSLDLPSLYAVSEMAKNELELFLNRLDQCCISMEGIRDNDVKLMLYFDEAHVLAENKVPNDLDGKDLYDVLCSCFNLFPTSPIFVIYLSTNSNISHLGPSGPLARSARARDNADALQAPITEIPFDCSSIFPLHSHKLKLEDVCNVEFMAQFGRPMFWTLLVGAGNHKDEILQTIIDLARAKLIRQHNISVEHGRIKFPAALTAVLDVLLNLDFEPRREAARIREAELVASHMRVAYSVPKHREYLRAGYPSEPILAEAAARQMDEFQTLASPSNTSVMANILQSEFTSGLLDQGARGEVVFRQLLSEAYRRAVRKDHPNDPQPHFSKGCDLITFVNQLFSEPYATNVLDSVPDNLKSSTTFANAFKDAVVRFTHFTKLADDTGTTTNAMFAAFVRGMAFICWSSQNIVDLLIPVLLTRGGMLGESTMTGLLIQVKRRKSKGSVIAYEIDQKALSFFPPSADSPPDTRPYVTLVVELGVQHPFSSAASTQTIIRDKLRRSAPNLSTPVLETPRKPKVIKELTTPSKLHIPKQPDRIAHSRDVHPRYSIFAYGCSDTVYRVISRSDRNVYKLLLGHRDLLDEHPRTDDKSLHAVRKMKPFWSAGTGCYHWIEEPYLQKYQALQDDGDDGVLDDRVLTGHYGDDTTGEPGLSRIIQ